MNATVILIMCLKSITLRDKGENCMFDWHASNIIADDWHGESLQKKIILKSYKIFAII